MPDQRPPIRLLIGLGVVTLLIRLLTMLPLNQAGYFDAYYYLHVAENLAAGRGLVEDVVWNFLDQSPVALQVPRPSHLYWMPLTSLIAWVGLVLAEGWVGSLRAAMLPFVLLSALLPPLSAWIAWRLWQRRDFALAAGVLTIFSGFYFLYWVVPDSYTPFALVVALALLGIWQGQQGRGWGWAAAGLGAGLAHLTRADGVLLVPLIAGYAWSAAGSGGARWRRFFLAGLLSGAGYLLVMGPWFVRNLEVAGTILPGGGTKTLWLRSYDEIFSYGVPLTAERFFSWGLWPIVRSKLQGLLWNSAILLGVLQLFLAPFAWLGWRQARQSSQVALIRPFGWYALILFLAMTLIFTLPARRGSLLHSASALIPWLCAFIPAGIELAARAFATRRRLDATQGWHVLGSGFVGLAALLSLWIFLQGLLIMPSEPTALPPWNQRNSHYQVVGDWLTQAGAEGPVLVVDPPGFAQFTERQAVVIPSDGVESLNRVATRLDARWLVIEADHATPYTEIWREGTPPAGWEVAATFEDVLGNPVRLFQRAGSQP